jgi:hypothetical protein
MKLKDAIALFRHDQNINLKQRNGGERIINEYELAFLFQLTKQETKDIFIICHLQEV